MMRETLVGQSSVVAAVGLLFVMLGPPAAGQTADDARFAELHARALRTAEAALSRAAEIRSTERPSAALLQEEMRLEVSIPAEWRKQLSARTWDLLQQTFEAEGVPRELVSVGWVESRFQPSALSPKGARGLWQLMPSTARRYGLEVSHERDERTHLGLATRAAARYLADLHRGFGDWLLALAAYNAGETAVQRAIERAGRADFWALSHRKLLPAETRDYVPAVLAAIESFRRANGPIWEAGRGRQHFEFPDSYADATHGRPAGDGR